MMSEKYVIREHNIKSSDGIHMLKGVVYEPVGEKKAILHIVHGMCEYIERYDAFMSYMAENGFVVCGYNHVGHKGTSDDGELGFFSDKDGYKILVNDVNEFGKSVKQEYKGLKYILMGHSMGSFVVRLTASAYPSLPDSLIIMGTGGPNPLASVGLALTSVMKAFGRARKVSPTINKMAFGSYNNKTEKRTGNDWLTHDTEIVDKYICDKYSMFDFTVSAMNDLIRMNILCNKDGCMSRYDTKMPILLISGEEDPVGDMGKGIKKVAAALSKRTKDLTVKTYKCMRHEILNEIGREKVYSDLLSWCDRQIN